MPYLAISSNGKAPQRQPLGGPSVLGRALGSEFWIEDRKLSRQHCRFEETHDGWAVIDLNSTNGTYVRGQRVSYHVLSDGDEIIVGKTKVVFNARAMPPQRPSAPEASRPTEVSAGSPSDTLMDSLPRFVPPPSVPARQKTVRPTGSAVSLAFKRPPARPLVERAPESRWILWLRSLFPRRRRG